VVDVPSVVPRSRVSVETPSHLVGIGIV